MDKVLTCNSKKAIEKSTLPAMSWIPHITVAAVTEHNGKFLLVRELVENRPVYNQPAGHLEENESLFDAVIRETLEEAAMVFTPEYLLGIYHWKQAHGRETYLRVAFTGPVSNATKARPLSEGILGTAWLDYQEALALPASELRSSMVLQCIKDYHAGTRYPLSVISHLEDSR